MLSSSYCALFREAIYRLPLSVGHEYETTAHEKSGSTVKFVLDSQLKITGSKPGRQRNGRARFLSPDAPFPSAVNMYPGVSQLIMGLPPGRGQ